MSAPKLANWWRTRHWYLWDGGDDMWTPVVWWVIAGLFLLAIAGAVWS